jgi:hypothetical protein
MKKARFIKDLPISGSGAVQKLYQIRDGVEITHIVASAVNNPFGFGVGPETHLFAANARGDITCWTELPGSQRGTLEIESVVGAQYDLQ